MLRDRVRDILLTYIKPHSVMQYPTCYRHMKESVNARQAGQFCAEDGSESNPSRLAFPDHQNDYLMLNKITNRTSTTTIWVGCAWNRLRKLWQRNDNTVDQDPWGTLNLPRPKKAETNKKTYTLDRRKKKKKKQKNYYLLGRSRTSMQHSCP